MKCNKLITSALLALGLVSSASAASSVTLNGTNYTVVYITGSTAFRSFVFSAVTAPTTFDSGAYVTQPASGVSGSTSAYNIYGTIGGTPTLLSFDFTGSEAGLAAITGLSVGISNPNTASSLTGYLGSGVVLPGTPNATAYLNPADGTSKVTAVADLAFSDTAQAVSLSAAKPALVDYGIVGVVPFTWAKGKLTGAQSSSYTNLVNVSTAQLKYLAGNGVEVASYFTGQAGDTNDIYLIGRNKGSGTRVNMVLDTQKGTSASASVDQWVPADSFYATGTQNALTFGTVQALTAAGGLVEVINDGYAGIGDWQGAGAGLAAGAVALSENGVYESDGAIETGTYSFWGHEHLYGPHGQSTSSAGGVVALFLTGGTYNESLGTASTAAGAIESSFGTGGGREANPFSHAAATGTASTGIDPAVVHANKPSDAGYPSQQN
jgi:hypothetical protein